MVTNSRLCEDNPLDLLTKQKAMWSARRYPASGYKKKRKKRILLCLCSYLFIFYRFHLILLHLMFVKVLHREIEMSKSINLDMKHLRAFLGRSSDFWHLLVRSFEKEMALYGGVFESSRAETSLFEE